MNTKTATIDGKKGSLPRGDRGFLESSQTIRATVATSLKDSEVPRFRLFVLFPLLLLCVFCGSLLLALILVLLTLISHCIPPLLQARTS